jgi:exopolysaccharide biosynthesis polyprenyl glycosylphosphotransferase
MNNRKTWLKNETIKKADFDVEGQVKSMSEDKKVEKKIYYRFACALILIAAATGMFAWVWIRFISVHNQTMHLTGLGNIGMALGIYAALYVLAGRRFRAFTIGNERKASIVAAQIVTLMVTDVVEIFISLAILGEFRFFWMITWRYLLLFCVQAVVNSLLTIIMVNEYRRVFPPYQILEIYGEIENDLSEKMNNVFYKFHVRDKVHYTASNIGERIQHYDAILINDIPAVQKNDIIKSCFEQDKRVYFTPKISDILVKSSSDVILFDTPVCLCRNDGITSAELSCKRGFDLIFSLLALILLSPVFLITAIAIKLEDGGPVFYRQERCTIGGKHFMIIKFRSMIVNAEADGRARPAGEKDDRITKVGRVIRAARIDELPQLINIVKGDMSVVGPRPERTEHVRIYTEEIPEFPFRNKVKGGLTGYAQVYGKYNTSALDKLKMDLQYITNFSLLLDFQIIMETLKILFSKESTEGFSETKSAEMHDHKQ